MNLPPRLDDTQTACSAIASRFERKGRIADAQAIRALIERTIAPVVPSAPAAPSSDAVPARHLAWAKREGVYVLNWGDRCVATISTAGPRIATCLSDGYSFASLSTEPLGDVAKPIELYMREHGIIPGELPISHSCFVEAAT